METVTLDSLVASEFEVVLGGEVLTGIFSIAGLVTYHVDEDGKRHTPPFKLSKMVQQNPSNPFNVWLRETFASRNGGQRPVRDIDIKAVDDGVVTRVWHVRGAYILSVAYSNFEEGGIDLVEEIITIGYGDIEDEFTVGAS